MSEKLMKLAEVYITWSKSKVKVVPKSDGVPKHDKYHADVGYYDPSEWKGMTPAEFFLETFTALTYEGDIKPKNVQHEFEKIEEYEEVEDKAWDLMRKMSARRKRAA